MLVPHCLPRFVTINSLRLRVSVEVYEGRFAAALLMDEMRRPWPEVLDALSRLHEWRPTKVSRRLCRVNH
jgi:hypothetical protein